MIIYEHNLIFVHIPKNAGSSIESFFGYNLWSASGQKKPDKKSRLLGMGKLRGENIIYQKFLQHCSISEIQDILSFNKLNIKDYTSFSVVRNPWDRFVSSFFYETRNKPKVRSNFKSFALNPFFSVKCHGFSQYSFLCDKNNKIIVDQIINFENLNKDFSLFCQKNNISNNPLPCINKTNHKHYTEYYDEETKQIVAERYAKDIDYFGYKFGE